MLFPSTPPMVLGRLEHQESSKGNQPQSQGSPYMAPSQRGAVISARPIRRDSRRHSGLCSARRKPPRATLPVTSNAYSRVHRRRRTHRHRIHVPLAPRPVSIAPSPRNGNLHAHPRLVPPHGSACTCREEEDAVKAMRVAPKQPANRSSSASPVKRGRSILASLRRL